MLDYIRYLNLDKKLDEILEILRAVRRKEDSIVGDLDALTAQVQAMIAAVEQSIATMNTLAADLTAAKEDPAAIAALASQLQAETAKLTAAITADNPPTAGTTGAASGGTGQPAS